MNDNLRLLAVFTQLSGFIIIFLMRTYAIDIFWQGCVLALMLLSALGVWLLRRYRKNKQIRHKR